MTDRGLKVCLCVATTAFLIPAEAAAQSGSWRLRAGVSWASPDGRFQDQRANGKIVTSDINGGIVPAIRVERQLNDALGVTFGFMGFSKHDFIIHQDFPDGSEFEARDDFTFRAVTAGVALHYLRDKRVGVLIEPYLLFAWYDDVSIASAGPPYDRTLDIDVDVKPVAGVGLSAGLTIPLAGESVALNPWLGLAAARFSGPFPDDPSIPGSGGEIGVGFTPVMAGLTIDIRL